MDFQARYNRLQQEVRDLKTAQTIPGLVQFYQGRGTIPVGTYSGVYTWTIQYKDVNDTNPPISYLDNPSAGDTLLEYDQATNSQKFEMHRINETIYVATFFDVISSRPIASITRDF